MTDQSLFFFFFFFNFFSFFLEFIVLDIEQRMATEITYKVLFCAWLALNVSVSVLCMLSHPHQSVIWLIIANLKVIRRSTFPYSSSKASEPVFFTQCNFAVKNKYNGSECLQDVEAIQNGQTGGLKCSLVSKTTAKGQHFWRMWMCQSAAGEVLFKVFWGPGFLRQYLLRLKQKKVGLGFCLGGG